MDLNQNLQKYFIQSGHELIRFSRSSVWKVKVTETFTGEGMPIHCSSSSCI